ncbi:MAG: hypothetical protein A2X12_11730 [Bacteroidetes bacterium GWE2_29_8]|nr:MAG: hypothetical protein A2X12_11730 [Bacteroidetes bacterium GWE2_29_8]OFY20466.1 MAG: hypothetical protein A2X02_02405 [Bacteroidetes bacterium GWF2_29_10]
MPQINSNVIFLIDDDVIYAKTIHHNLVQHFGSKFKIYVYNTGEEALKNMKHKPGIVILDYYLDGVNKEAKAGLDILKEIKKIAPLTHIVMLSMEDSLKIANDCVDNGAFDYIVKSETAFVKILNIIKNIFKNFLLKRKVRSERIGLFVAFLIISLFVAVILYFYKANAL